MFPADEDVEAGVRSKVGYGVRDARGVISVAVRK